jgi:hypothetical protein
MLIWTRQHELIIKNAQLIDPLAISPAFGMAGPPPALDRAGADVQAWVRRASAQLEKP